MAKPCIFIHAVHCSEDHLLEGHLLPLISPAKVESSCHVRLPQECPRSLAACLFQLTTPGRFLCLFVRHRLNVCAITLILDPFLSFRRNVPNWTYLVAISTGILITLPSVHVNFKRSGRVGLVPRLQSVFTETAKKDVHC